MDFWEWLTSFFGNAPFGSGLGPIGPAGGIATSSEEIPPSPGDQTYLALENERKDTFDALDTSITGDPSQLQEDLNAGVGSSNPLADFLRDNPHVSPEQAYYHLARDSDEYAEKWLDYLLEKQSIAEANAYTASREDTAYQRLTADLKKAGLNPALLYGGSASISNAGSSGVVNMSGSAKSDQVSNFTKLKKILLSYMTYQWQKEIGEAKFGSQFGIQLMSMILSMF